MSQSNLSVLVDRNYRVEFVQGEDRTFDILLVDRDKQMPVDLTDSSLMFAFPAASGGAIKRRSLPLLVTCATAVTLNGFSVFTQKAHGLADSELVTVAAAAQGATLPAPFAADTPYIVTVFDANTFGLSTGATPFVLTVPSSSTVGLNIPGVSVETAVLGKVNLSLSAAVTTAITSGQGQTYQLTLSNAAGLSQILIVNDQLDVFEQPFP